MRYLPEVKGPGRQFLSTVTLASSPLVPPKHSLWLFANSVDPSFFFFHFHPKLAPHLTSIASFHLPPVDRPCGKSNLPHAIRFFPSFLFSSSPPPYLPIRHSPFSSPVLLPAASKKKNPCASLGQLHNRRVSCTLQIRGPGSFPSQSPFRPQVTYLTPRLLPLPYHLPSSNFSALPPSCAALQPPSRLLQLADGTYIALASGISCQGHTPIPSSEAPARSTVLCSAPKRYVAHFYRVICPAVGPGAWFAARSTPAPRYSASLAVSVAAFAPASLSASALLAIACFFPPKEEKHVCARKHMGFFNGSSCSSVVI